MYPENLRNFFLPVRISGDSSVPAELFRDFRFKLPSGDFIDKISQKLIIGINLILLCIINLKSFVL